MYFPQSQIKTNLYTNGEEYILSTTGEAYIGYYFATSTGKKYTGKTPQDGINILLILPSTPFNDTPLPNPAFTPNSSLIEYSVSNIDDTTIPFNYFTLNPQSQERSIPQFNLTLPTDKDKSLGAFQRYFCKKNNELIYIEIDKNTFNLLQSKSSTIAWDLYTPLSTLWYIKGNKEQTYKANKGLITLIEQNQKWYGFTQWFQDKFLKYYLES
jgi:hypothetical protein